MDSTLTKVAAVVVFCLVALSFANTVKTALYGDLIETLQSVHQDKE